MLMKQITNRLIEIGYLNAGSNFRNAAFEKQRRINIYFQKRSMSGILLLLPLKKLKKGWPTDFRLLDQSVFLSETSFDAAKVLNKNVPDVWNKLAAGSV